MNLTQLLNFLSENGYSRFPKSYREPYLRSVKSDNGVVIHQILVDVFYSPDDDKFFWKGTLPSVGGGEPGEVHNVYKVKDFALLYKAYSRFKSEGLLDDNSRLDFCLMLIRLFYNEYSGGPVTDYGKLKKDDRSLQEVVADLYGFKDELLSPVVKEMISSTVSSLVNSVYSECCQKVYDLCFMKTEDLHEPEMEYCRCKKTNPLVSLPGFVNMFSDYSNISLPNCSGR